MAGILAQVIPRDEHKSEKNIQMDENSRVLVIILQIVQAGVTGRVPQPPVRKHLCWIIQDELLRVDVFQEPGERFTLQILLECKSVLHIS